MGKLRLTGGLVLTAAFALTLLVSGCNWLTPKRQTNVSKVAELAQAHEFIIVDVTQSRTGAHMITSNVGNNVQVRLTPKGEEILDTSEQGVLGLNGQRAVNFTQNEYSEMLDKLHSCLEAKGGSHHH